MKLTTWVGDHRFADAARAVTINMIINGRRRRRFPLGHQQWETFRLVQEGVSKPITRSTPGEEDEMKSFQSFSGGMMGNKLGRRDADKEAAGFFRCRHAGRSGSYKFKPRPGGWRMERI